MSNSQFVESRVSDDDEANLVENVEKQNVDVDVNPEEVFCRKVGDALTAGVNFVEAAFETIEVSIKLFFYVSPIMGRLFF